MPGSLLNFICKQLGFSSSCFILHTQLIAPIFGKNFALDNGGTKDEMQADWPQLPDEVINLSIGRLDFGERVRMSGVCESFLQLEKYHMIRE